MSKGKEAMSAVEQVIKLKLLDEGGKGKGALVILESTGGAQSTAAIGRSTLARRKVTQEE